MSDGATICPHCGYDLVADVVIEKDGFTLDPRGEISFNSTVIALTSGEVAVLMTIAKAGGRWMRAAVVGDRMSECENPENMVAVLLSRARRKFRELDIPFPVDSRRGRACAEFGGGYRWAGGSRD